MLQIENVNTKNMPEWLIKCMSLSVDVEQGAILSKQRIDHYIKKVNKTN